MKFRARIKFTNKKTGRMRTVDEVVQVQDDGMGVAARIAALMIGEFCAPMMVAGWHADIECWPVQQATDMIFYN